MTRLDGSCQQPTPLPEPTLPCLSAKPKLTDFRRIVVKVGSSLLGRFHRRQTAPGMACARWARTSPSCMADGRDVLVVSSGSIALGRCGTEAAARPAGARRSQAAAAVGQIALARIWAEMLWARHHVQDRSSSRCGDTEERRRYLNARSTIDQLLRMEGCAGHQRERHRRHQRNPLRRQ